MWQNIKPGPHLQSAPKSDFYAALLAPSGTGTIIDIGANVGSKTELFRSLAQRVIAVEPDPDMVGLLATRFRWRSNVEVRHCAVGDREGTLTLFKFTGAEAYNTASPEWAKSMMAGHNHMMLKLPEPERIEVPATTLAALEARYHPVSFIKIDAEGLEYQILSTLSRPVPVISLEFNLPEFETSLHKSIAKLEELDSGYRFNVTTSEPPRDFEFDEWLPGRETCERVAQHGWRYLELYARNFTADRSGS